MQVPNTKLESQTKNYDQLVQSKVTKAFDQQLQTLKGAYAHKVDPTILTKIFLASIDYKKSEDKELNFTNNPALIQKFQANPSRSFLDSISREDFVYSALTFMESITKADPKKLHIGLKSIADFIEGPRFKQALNILYAPELKALVERDELRAIEQDKARQLRTERARNTQSQMLEALASSSQATSQEKSRVLKQLAQAAAKKGQLYKGLGTNKAEIIVERVFALQDASGRIYRDQFDQIFMDVSGLVKKPGRDALARLRKDLGFGRQDFKNGSSS